MVFLLKDYYSLKTHFVISGFEEKSN